MLNFDSVLKSVPVPSMCVGVEGGARKWLTV